MPTSKENKKKVTVPRYQQIAVEIAQRIIDDRYQVGEKIHARSTLASNFNVSPETARKAINVLVDLGIMEVHHGSGAYVSSKEKAQNFIAQYQEVQSVQEIRQALMESMARQKEEWDNFSGLIETLVNQTKKAQHISPFLPYELLLTEEAAHLEKSVHELNIWQVTGATVIAIQTDEVLLLSPGPYAKFSIGNKIYFIGNELAFQRMVNFFYPTPEILE